MYNSCNDGVNDLGSTNSCIAVPTAGGSETMREYSTDLRPQVFPCSTKWI